VEADFDYELGMDYFLVLIETMIINWE